MRVKAGSSQPASGAVTPLMGSPGHPVQEQLMAQEAFTALAYLIKASTLHHTCLCISLFSSEPVSIRVLIAHALRHSVMHCMTLRRVQIGDRLKEHWLSGITISEAGHPLACHAVHSRLARQTFAYNVHQHRCNKDRSFWAMITALQHECAADAASGVPIEHTLLSMHDLLNGDGDGCRTQQWAMKSSLRLSSSCGRGERGRKRAPSSIYAHSLCPRLARYTLLPAPASLPL